MKAILAILALCTVRSVLGGFSKVQYMKSDHKITAINTCKSSSNAVYTSADGYINLWRSYLLISSYSISVSDWHLLECSRYGEKLDHVYIAVLGSDGVVTLWEQIQSVFSSRLEQKYFTDTFRNASATAVSVGGGLLAIGYSSLQIIDIFNAQGGGIANTITIQREFRQIKLDSQGYLMVLTVVNGTLVPTCYFDPSNNNKMQQLNFRPLDQQNYTLDYQAQEKGILFLIAGQGNTLEVLCAEGTCQLRPENSLSVKRYCGAEQAYSKGYTVQLNSGDQVSLQNKILDFVCSTDVNFYLQQLIYIVSSDGDAYFIDVYQLASAGYVLLFSVLFCCCFACLRGFASNPRTCTEVSLLVFKVVDFLFCWCPTRDNMDQIEGALEEDNEAMLE